MNLVSIFHFDSDTLIITGAVWFWCLIERIIITLMESLSILTSAQRNGLPIIVWVSTFFDASMSFGLLISIFDLFLINIISTDIWGYSVWVIFLVNLTFFFIFWRIRIDVVQEATHLTVERFVRLVFLRQLFSRNEWRVFKVFNTSEHLTPTLSWIDN